MPAKRPRDGGLLLFPELAIEPPNDTFLHGPAMEPPVAPDQAARDAALDPTRSWIVQAPAGAGKTELLTQRYLSLLAQVDDPEEILAITFTRAATAEMRGRILAALDQAHALCGAAPAREEAVSLRLARTALAHSEQRGWRLLEHPHRLDIQTIDSLCMRLAHGQPLLARLGGRLEPTEQAAGLYALAARRTFEQLGRAEKPLDQSLRHLLLLRDNNLGDSERLLAGLLEHREQWRRVLVLGESDQAGWAALRSRLEAPFTAEVERVLGELRRWFEPQPILVQELLTLAQYACDCGSDAGIRLLDGVSELPPGHGDFVGHWTAIRSFLLKNDGDWRIAVNKTHGFPADGSALPKSEQQAWKRRMIGLLQSLSRSSDGERLRSLLCLASTLPSARYEEPRWETLRAIFRVLRRAVAELHVVFAERNQVDFAELSIAAATVLDDEESSRGLLASEVRRHLLIDEFQDTSRRQHQLIGRLLREWRPGDGRTCLVVGDPMQSIYLFRQAEVELFGRVQRRGLDCGSHAHPCAGLTLATNFRSHAGLVEPLNRFFTAIFAPALPGQSSEVPFSPSTAWASSRSDDSLAVHAFFSAAGDAESSCAARAAQLARIVALVEAELPRIAEAEREGRKEYKVAVLGRAKNHLAPIAEALRERMIPFRAIELENLNERQEILDLQMLLRALLHPGDRIAWLSVLRAPWCGLTLRDLHLLTGADDLSLRARLVPELIATRAGLLSADGRERLLRVSAVLEHARARRFQAAQSLASWLERAWTSLGAPAYLGPTELENTEVFFGLLGQMAPDGIDACNGALDLALTRLCAAPDARVDENFSVQLMTIHKAKGLGFEVVIVPSLERSVGFNGLPLVALLERAREAPDAAEQVDELLVAPLYRRGDKDRTYTWIQAERRKREAAERKRVFYVACTRARRSLHLLGIAEQTAGGELRTGRPDSLLATAWPALAPIFAAQLNAPAAIPPAIFPASHPDVIERIAASAGPAAEGLLLERVPPGFAVVLPDRNGMAGSMFSLNAAGAAVSPPAPLDRPHGSLEHRARGVAVHAMLEMVSRAWAAGGAAAQSASLTPELRRVALAWLRRAGLNADRARAIRDPLIAVVHAAAASPEGRWILQPHPGAESEWSLSTWSPTYGGLRTLRVDRVFRAGEQPLQAGRDWLWIVDYKTGADPGGDAIDQYLEKQKNQWRPQLEAYGEALRAMQSAQLPFRYALYFPELQRLVWWGGRVSE